MLVNLIIFITDEMILAMNAIPGAAAVKAIFNVNARKPVTAPIYPDYFYEQSVLSFPHPPIPTHVIIPYDSHVIPSGVIHVGISPSHLDFSLLPLHPTCGLY
jgi:hypothetical protein